MPAGTLDSLKQLCELARSSITLPPECGGHTFWLQELSAEDLLEIGYRFGSMANADRKEFQAHVLRLCLSTEDGAPMFARTRNSGLSADDAAKQADEQVQTVLRLKWHAFRLLAAEALKVSGVLTVVTPEGEEKN